MARSRRLQLGAAAALALFASACAMRGPASQTVKEPPLAARVSAPGLLFELKYTAPDRAEVGRVGSGLLAAAAQVTRWGSFRDALTVELYPDHAALEAALDKPGYPWLHGWSEAKRVLLQSPRSWDPVSSNALQKQFSELLVHELTHVLMYQLMESDDGPTWNSVSELPPFWFVEGMASVTAAQGAMRLSGVELARWIDQHPGVDVLNPFSELARTEHDAVYGAAHRAFELLVQISGDQAVRDVMRGVRAGARFPDAFGAATGYSLTRFEHEAVRSKFDLASLDMPRSASHGAGGP